jgi:hypothetical protein
MRKTAFTSSDRETITTVHAEGAARGMFGRLDFINDGRCDLAALYGPTAAPGDHPAFVLTPLTVDVAHLIAKAWQAIINETDSLRTSVTLSEPFAPKRARKAPVATP